MTGIATASSASVRPARARRATTSGRPAAPHSTAVRSPRSSRSTARVSMRPPKTHAKRGDQAAAAASGDAAEDNAFTRFQEGISDD